jgi:hypothetical protein
MLTVIDDPAEPVLQDKLPVAVVDKTDTPAQVLSTVTMGVDGVPGCVLITAIVCGDWHPAAVLTVTLYVSGASPLKIVLDW